MSDHTIKRASLEELKKMRKAGELHCNPHAPEGESLGREFWEKAMVSSPKSPPKSVHLKLEPEVFEFFKAKGKGHLTKMQEVLKAYVLAHQ